MPKPIQPIQPQGVPPRQHPELIPPVEPGESPIVPDDPEIIPPDDPFENPPPYEEPVPGEGP